MAFALPVFNMDRLAVVIPICSANSLDHFRVASIISKLMIIGIAILLDYFHSLTHFLFLITSEKAINADSY
jgi:hypothetical protein